VNIEWKVEHCSFNWNWNEKWTRANVCSYACQHSWLITTLSFNCTHFSAFVFSFRELFVCVSWPPNKTNTIVKVSSWVRRGAWFTTITFIPLHSFRAAIFALWEFFVGVIGAQNEGKLDLQLLPNLVRFFICGDTIHSFSTLVWIFTSSWFATLHRHNWGSEWKHVRVKVSCYV